MTMTTTTKTKPLDKMLRAELEDLGNGFDDNEKELKIYSHGTHVMTVRVFKNFVDVEYELDRTTYNLFEVKEDGVIINDVPTLE